LRGAQSAPRKNPPLKAASAAKVLDKGYGHKRAVFHRNAYKSLKLHMRNVKFTLYTIQEYQMYYALMLGLQNH